MVGVGEILGLHAVKQVVEDVYSYVKRRLGIEDESDEERLVEVLEQENELLREEKQELREEKEELREELDEKKTQLTEKREELESQVEAVSQSDRILNMLERRGISREMLVERYDDSIWVIVVYYGYQRDAAGQKKKFVKNRLEEEYDAKHVAGGMRVVPPSKVPSDVRDGDDLEEWIENEIYRGNTDYKSIINFAAVLDLKDIFTRSDFDAPKKSWKTVYQAIDFGEELGSEGFVDFLQSSPISPIEPLQDGDIAFFASRVVSGKELETIHENQKEIEDRLGNPNLRELADKGNQDELSAVLGDYLSNPDEVANSIIEEAQLLNEEFNEPDTQSD